MGTMAQSRASGRGCSGTRASPGTAGSPDARAASVDRRLCEGRQEFLRFFRRRLARPEDAEDAVQDFCVKALRGADRLEDASRIDAWLARILRHTLIDHYRRRAAGARVAAAYEREMETAADEPRVEDDGAACRCIHDVLPTLRPDYAEVLTLADLREEPRKRIAAQLGLTPNNVAVRLHRARRALRQKLAVACAECDGWHGQGCACGAARGVDERGWTP